MDERDIASAYIARRAAGVPLRPHGAMHLKKIGVFIPNWIGDAVMCTPTLGACGATMARMPNWWAFSARTWPIAWPERRGSMS